MAYCNLHKTNNCLECAIDKQTREIVKAIEDSKTTIKTGIDIALLIWITLIICIMISSVLRMATLIFDT